MCVMCIQLTSIKFLRFTSHKFLQPISVDIYHPLKDVAVNWMPPQSNIIEDTAGTAYHLKFNSENHLYLLIENGWRKEKWTKKKILRDHKIKDIIIRENPKMAGCYCEHIFDCGEKWFSINWKKKKNSSNTASSCWPQKVEWHKLSGVLRQKATLTWDDLVELQSPNPAGNQNNLDHAHSLTQRVVIYPIRCPYLSIRVLYTPKATNQMKKDLNFIFSLFLKYLMIWFIGLYNSKMILIPR